MRIKETRIELDAQEIGIPNLPDSTKIVTSHEFAIDLGVRMKQLCSIKTSEFSDEEIKSWKKWDQYLKDLDIDEARNRVIFVGGI